MKDVLERSKMKPNARLVLLAIASHANDDGEAFPGIARLSKLTNFSERSVMRHVKELERLNELTVTRRKKKSNVYRITLQPCHALNHMTQPALEGDSPGSNKVTPLSAESSEEIIRESDHAPQGFKEEEVKPPTPFDQFFDAMPSRAGGIKQYREKARQIFERFSETDQRRCITAAREYRKVCRNTDQYPRDPYRFLDGGTAALWLDYVPKDKRVCPVAKPITDPPQTPVGPEQTERLAKFFRDRGLSGLQAAVMGKSEA